MDAVEVRMRCLEAASRVVQPPQVQELAATWARWILEVKPRSPPAKLPVSTTRSVEVLF